MPLRREAASGPAFTPGRNPAAVRRREPLMGRDGPVLKRLSAKMPQVYRSPGSKVSGEGKTDYLTVRGEKTVLPGETAIRLADIPDGVSNTIVAVEVADDKAVLWTRPDDFEYDQQDPMKGLIGLWPEGFIAALADSSVRFVRSSIDPSVLKAFFTRNGGEKVAPGALRQ